MTEENRLGHSEHRSPGVVREIAAAGHEIGVHGWRHRPLLLRKPARDYDDFARARGTVADITGTRPTLFRPPYGIMSTAAHVAARASNSPPCCGPAGARTGPRGPYPSRSTAR
ncbi:polysaccharide deacetylase family protein [Streptomyces sp. NPDC090798]|uniref:polysaccharide deacetylase family protein n=1 Tax=Streptomyces sp. NPDC090798 TaxID=3365968 RepID=UPI0037FD69FC